MEAGYPDFENAELAIGVVGRAGNRLCIDLPTAVAEAFGNQSHVPVLVSVSGIINRATLLPKKGGKRRVFVSQMTFKVLQLSESDLVDVKLVLDEEMVRRKQRLRASAS